ncbi:hypothetical protein PY650_10640 [Rhizobium calliandrae]|uniref:DUF883 domain-containing protein n=1 Tax=Rhizobium calliandrae TaxID=1312182 RepID=A0ABT7KC22_9HYPH|nr:hypothetical protein [Rhizobium calliandrae]MDL2406117.1 hypothetical protein [Rhizobium calliandrae]
MVKMRQMEPRKARAGKADIRTRQALDQAAGGSADIDGSGADTREAKYAYYEPGTDDSRSADTKDCESQRMKALDAAAGRIAEAVRASRPREHHTMRNATVLAIGGIAGFLLRGVLTGR